MKITACIVSNQEVEPELLAHVSKFAQEIVVNFNNITLDPSYKETLKKEWGPKLIILENPFTDWATIRNQTIEAATNNWCLTIDNGERLSDILVKEIVSLPEDIPYDIVQFARVHFVIDPPPLPDHFLHKRLFRRSLRYHGVLYEHLIGYKTITSILTPGAHALHYNTRQEEIEKTTKREEYLKQKIQEFKEKNDQDMVMYCEYYLWVLKEIFMKEYSVNSSPESLAPVYALYDIRTAEVKDLLDRVERRK